MVLRNFVAFMGRLFLVICLVFNSLDVFSQSVLEGETYKNPPKEKSEIWADSVLKTLTFKQMLGQTMMVPAWTRNAEIDPVVLSQIRDWEVGGIIFFQGTAVNQSMALNFYQQESRIPLLISMDAEWGAAMRLDHIHKFPYPLTLGAARDTQWAYRVGKYIGRELRMLGIHLNYAPVVDLNVNPNNPIIGFRSFGEDPQLTFKLADAYNRGMESEGIWGCAKHFPGHGNTLADSHKELPVVDHTPSSLQKELIPFDMMLKAGVKSVMVGHLKVPLLDSMPTSLSRPVVTDLLRNELKFNGLIITDALNMKGIANHFGAIDAGIRALKAGNDILCFPEDVAGIITEAIRQRDSGWLDSSEIAQKVRRILFAKHQLGVISLSPVNVDEIDGKIAANYAEYEKNQPLNKAISVLQGGKDFFYNFPLKPFQKDTIRFLVFGDGISRTLLRRMEWYSNVQLIWAKKYDSIQQLISLADSLKNERWVIFNGNQKMWSNSPRKLPAKMVQFLNATQVNPWLIHVGNFYALRDLPRPIPVVVGYETGEEFQEASVDALFGRNNILGKPPVKLSVEPVPHAGLIGTDWNWERFPKHPNYNLDDSCGNFKKLNALMDSVISSGASTSAQLLVLKDGQKLYSLSRGNYLAHFSDGDTLLPVDEFTVFDIASITKIVGMTAAMMKLFEEREYRLDDPIGRYWKEIRRYPWSHLPISNFLTHRTGLPPFLPLYQRIKNHPDTLLFDSMPTRLQDSVWRWICKTEPKGGFNAEYVYSDLNAIILGKFVEHLSDKTLDEFLYQEKIFKGAEMNMTRFHPNDYGLTSRVAPTAMDSAWRGLIRGEVHDPSAYFLGGVSGNAGLFSNSIDLAKFMQALLNSGRDDYDGYRLFKPETVKKFTEVYYTERNTAPNYRGLGFDKPHGNNVYQGAPASLFGHSGFTGTWLWADPESNMVFVFLSNRTYPNDQVNLLAKKGWRGKILSTVVGSW